MGASGEGDRIATGRPVPCCSMTRHSRGIRGTTRPQPCPCGVGTPSGDGGTCCPSRAARTPAGPGRCSRALPHQHDVLQAVPRCGTEPSQRELADPRTPCLKVQMCPRLVPGGWRASSSSVPELWSVPSPLQRDSLPSSELFPNPMTRLAASDFPGWERGTPTPWGQAPPGDWSDCLVPSHQYRLPHLDPEKEGPWRMVRGL